MGTAKLIDIDSDMVQQMVFTLAEQGYSESVMTKAKIAAFSVLKMAAAKHYINTVPVLNITIPRAKKQDDDRQVKKNWLRDDELALYEAECRRTYVPKKSRSMPVKRSWSILQAISCCSISRLCSSN